MVGGAARCTAGMPEIGFLVFTFCWTVLCEVFSPADSCRQSRFKGFRSHAETNWAVPLLPHDRNWHGILLLVPAAHCWFLEGALVQHRCGAHFPDPAAHPGHKFAIDGPQWTVPISQHIICSELRVLAAAGCGSVYNLRSSCAQLTT